VVGFHHWANGLRFVGVADTEAKHRQLLASLILTYLRGRSSHASEGRLAVQAAEKAARYTWTRPVSIYEFTYGSSAVTWYRTPRDLTRTTLPVAMLTEEVPVKELRGSRYGLNCPPLTLNPFDEIPDPGDPFLHEPSLEYWDPDEYAVFSDLIEQIAYQVGVPTGQFVGSFILATLAQMGPRLENLGELEGTWGRQLLLKHFATALGLLNTLMFRYSAAMLGHDSARRLPCPLARNAGQWASHLQRAYFPLRRQLVASMFVTSCQDALLEELERSAVEIQRRIAGLQDYMTVTRMLLVVLLSDLVELTELRNRIADRLGRFMTNPMRVASAGMLSWQRSATDLVDTVATSAEHDLDLGGGVVLRGGSCWIRDGHGRWWSRQQLDAAIDVMRAQAFEADPLLEKLTDIPDVVRRLREAQRLDSEGLLGGAEASAAVDREFLALLEEIRTENENRTRQVRQDREIAYGLAAFQEPEASSPTEGRKSDIGARMYGIHEKADKRLRPLFSDEQIYVDALAALARHEIGKAKFSEFLNLVGLPFLGIFFPEVVFVIGMVQAMDSLQTAFEHRGIQEAMLTGDDILSKAQVEAELWGSWLGLTLAFLPELPKGARGVRALWRGEVRAALRQGMREIVTRLGEATVQRLVYAYIRDVTTGYLLNLALSAAIGRFTAAVAAQVEHGGGDSILDLPTIIDNALNPVVHQVPSQPVDAGEES
jgi:hypothetical protein